MNGKDHEEIRLHRPTVSELRQVARVLDDIRSPTAPERPYRLGGDQLIPLVAIILSIFLSAFALSDRIAALDERMDRVEPALARLETELNNIRRLLEQNP